jgi:hypothetical protein
MAGDVQGSDRDHERRAGGLRPQLQRRVQGVAGARGGAAEAAADWRWERRMDGGGLGLLFVGLLVGYRWLRTNLPFPVSATPTSIGNPIYLLEDSM